MGRDRIIEPGLGVRNQEFVKKTDPCSPSWGARTPGSALEGLAYAAAGSQGKVALASREGVKLHLNLHTHGVLQEAATS